MHQTTYKRSAELLEAEVGEELLALDPVGGRCYGLNEVGAAVWRQLEQPSTLAQLVESLEAEYDVDKVNCTRELQALLDKLIELGLVVKATVPVGDRRRPL